MKSTREVLQCARNLLAAGWTTASYARDKYGHRTSYAAPEATSFCAIGALRRCGGDESMAYGTEGHPAIRALFPFLPKAFPGDVVSFNDDPATKHGDVLALFDQAIAAQEGP